MRIRTRQAALVAALFAALAVPAAGIGSGSGRLALPTKVGPGEGKLVMLAWDGFLEPLWVRPFEKKSGCKVERRYAASSGEMVSLMRQRGGRYDLVSASGDVSLLLVLGKDVAPVNVKLVPGWKDFSPTFRSPPTSTSRGVNYGISLQWAPNTLLFNTKQVKPAPRSWGAVYDARHKGKITVPNNPLQIADAALYLMKRKPALGIRDPYELTKPQFAAAVALLERQKPLLKRYWSYASDEIQDFRNGDAIIGAAWPYQRAALQAGKVPVADVAPSEGITGLLDTWMVSAKAKHVNCAYRWLQYVSTPKVQAQQAVTYGAAPVNSKACPFMNRLSAGSCQAFHANAAPAYTRSIRFWRSPIADCGWGGRKDCVPYKAWQTAWAKITG